MSRAGAEITDKEVPVKNRRLSPIPGNQPLISSAPARVQRFQIKIYIDYLGVGEILSVLISLPRYLIDVIKEEWFWWTKMYKHEISSPVDWQKERVKSLAESRRRIKKIKKRGGSRGHENSEHGLVH